MTPEQKAIQASAHREIDEILRREKCNPQIFFARSMSPENSMLLMCLLDLSEKIATPGDWFPCPSVMLVEKYAFPRKLSETGIPLLEQKGLIGVREKDIGGFRWVRLDMEKVLSCLKRGVDELAKLESC